MIYKLSNQDLKDIQEKLSSEELTYFEKIKNQKFNVGDILIKKEVSTDEVDNTVSIQTYENSLLYRRYLVIHVDEVTNTSFYKEVMENGKLDKELNCTVCFDDIGYRGTMSFFEVDPSFVDAVIFGEEFDLSSLLKEEKQRKTRLVKMNRSTAVTFDNLKDVNQFIRSLSPNDMLYYHSNDKETFNENDFISLKLKKPRKAKFNTYAQTRRFRRHISRNLDKKALNDSYVLYLRCLEHDSLITSCELIGQALYKVKPIILKEQP